MRVHDGIVWHANFDTGFWESADGQRLQPGFRTTVGWENYTRIFTEERFLKPFLRVLGWTVSFATLNTLLTFALGLFLAVALSWDQLRGKAFYRLMLFLPYAVPGFEFHVLDADPRRIKRVRIARSKAALKRKAREEAGQADAAPDGGVDSEG